MGLTPLGVLQPPKKGEHEKAAMTEGRLEKRSLLAAAGLSYPEKQL
jgi:hypothetical protein